MERSQKSLLQEHALAPCSHREIALQITEIMNEDQLYLTVLNIVLPHSRGTEHPETQAGRTEAGARCIHETFPRLPPVQGRIPYGTEVEWNQGEGDF